MSDNNSYRHILKYTGVFGSVQGLNVLVSLVRNKFVALLLGPSGMGLVSLLNTAMSFISQASNLGIAVSAVRHMAELYDAGDEKRLAEYIKVVRAWCILAALLGVALCFMVAPLFNLLSFSCGNGSGDRGRNGYTEGNPAPAFISPDTGWGNDCLVNDHGADVLFLR